MVELNVINLVLAAMILLDIGFGSLLFFLGRRVTANQTFAVWMFALAGWTMTILGFFNAGTPVEALGWMRAAYVEAILAVISFWYFATQFPDPKKLNPLIHVLNALTLCVFGYVIMTTDFIVVEVSRQPWDVNVILNPLGWWIFASYLIFYFLFAHFLLFKSYLKATGLLKTQLLYIVASVFIGVEVGGVICNLILPSPIFLDWRFIWLGPTLSTLIVVPFMAYATARHRLFSVKEMLTQIFVGYMIVFAVIDLLLASTIFDFIIRALLALAVIVFGILLVRRINEDERRREELRLMAEELASKNERLKEMDKIKTDFISIASHQLRTPISVIKGYLALVLDGAYGKVDGPLREKVTAMIDMAERLVIMINEMLNVSRIERNTILYTCQEFDLTETVRGLVLEMQGKAAEKRLGMQFTANDDPGVAMVHADGDKVKEVLSNLIDNAIKYSVSGTIEVGVKARFAHRDVVVTVADEGYGIAEDDAKHMFEKFYRSTMPEIARLAGTGLGLYVCRMFLRDMGGDIWIERTALGKGTVFAFTVPMDRKGHCAPPSQNSPQVP